MPLRFFVIPALHHDIASQELNAFLATHQVLSIERHLINQGLQSYWSVCVDFMTNGSSKGGAAGANLSRGRIDYKTILTGEEFEVFSRLRELRKGIAVEEALPVYAVFTNEQLAQAVQRRCRSVGDLKQVEGIGDAKVDKYAGRLLAILTTLEAKSNAEV
jgi:superfamily II DNA helicase RecQ